MKKYQKVIITIVLGALGSALWEVFLKRLFLLIYDRFVTYAFQLFNDSFYKRVAYSIDSPAFLTYFFFMYLIAFFFIVSPKRWLNTFYNENEPKHDLLLIYVWRFVIFIILMYNALIVSFANNIARRTLNNIEIISPYISDMEYKTLRSDFYQMNSKDDYLQIISVIENIATENDLITQ